MDDIHSQIRRSGRSDCTRHPLQLELFVKYTVLRAAVALTVLSLPLKAQANLNDLEMAHVAVTASNIDIRYAHLALAISDNASVRAFAETMIRDHSAVNGQVAALAKRLNIEAKDNAISQSLLSDAAKTRETMSKLRGTEFDRFYAKNELAYHETVNGVVEKTFIPNAKNSDVKAAFTAALSVFRKHEQHARSMSGQLAAKP
jgi:putative membrane protein